MTTTSAPPPDANEHIKSLSSTITFNIMHPEIIYTHVLPRLDGATPTPAAFISSLTHRLCTKKDLWHKICATTWPSLLNPTVCHVISMFPSSYRFVYSDVFPSLHYFSPLPHHSSPPPSKLIFIVDIYYKGNLILGETHRNTENWFLSSLLWVNALKSKELVPMLVKFLRKDKEWMNELEENLKLSWIVMDPSRKRATNVSSWIYEKRNSEDDRNNDGAVNELRPGAALVKAVVERGGELVDESMKDKVIGRGFDYAPSCGGGCG